MKLANNAKSILKTDIVSDSNSFLVQDGEGALFKFEIDGATLNEFIIFAEEIENESVVKREALKVKRDGDTFFIIERKVQDVVSNDTATPKIRERKKFNFTAGITQISIYLNEDNIEEVNSNTNYIKEIKENGTLETEEILEIKNQAGEKGKIKADIEGNTNINGNLISTGDITANKFKGDGSELTGITAEIEALSTSNTAGEDLVENDIVYIKESDGKSYKTNSNYEDKAGVSGVVLADTLSGENGKIIFSGLSGLITGMTINDNYFVNYDYIKQGQGDDTKKNDTASIGISSGFGEIDDHKQTFTISKTQNIETIKIPLCKTGSPSGNATIGIYKNSDDSELISETLDVTTLTSEYIEYNFNFSLELTDTSSEAYYIGVHFVGNDIDNCINWEKIASDVYVGGSLYTKKAGESWVDKSIDKKFIINFTENSISSNMGQFISFIGKAISTEQIYIGKPRYIGDILNISNNVEYRAVSDGFVYGYVTGADGDDKDINGYLNYEKVSSGISKNATGISIYFPVKMGDTYKISTTNGTYNGYFTPLK